MSRLVTTGFESRLYGAVAVCGEGQGVFSAGTVTADQANQFDGTSCAKCATGATSVVGIERSTTALGTTYYFRAAMKFSSVAPSTNICIIKQFAANSTEVILAEAGAIVVWSNQTSSNIIETGFKPAAGKSYLFEIKCLIPSSGNSTFALRIYNEAGETAYESGDKSVALGNTKITFWEAGHMSSDVNSTVYVSHMALNDSTGEKENSWSGFAKVTMLKPISDKARTGWVAGAAPTTEALWEALAKAPPEGKAVGSSTHGSQIKDAENNATDTYQANLQTYTTGTVTGTVNVVMGIFRTGNSTTTSRNIGLKGVSNPEITETLKATLTTVVGTETTGWSTGVTGPVYAPTVTKGESPVLQIRKATASTNVATVDFLGLYVEYVPATAHSYVVEAADSLTFTDASSKKPIKTVADALAFTETLIKSFAGAFADSIAFTAALSKNPTKRIADALAFADSLSKTFDKTGADSVVFADTTAKTTARESADVIAFTESTKKTSGKQFADGVSFTDLFGRGLKLSFADIIKFTDRVFSPSFVGTFLRYLGRWVRVK